MTPRVFTKLLALLILLLGFHTLVMELVFHRFVEYSAGGALRLLGREALWSGLIALAVALPVAAWVALRISSRLRHVVAFARRIANGDLSARLDAKGKDELSAMEDALNQTAERLGKDFAELESSRHELAVMLDSMQEGVIAITSTGYIRWSNAVMQRIAGPQLVPGRPLVHAVRDPELLSCVRGAMDRRELCIGRASLLAPGRVFEINAAPLPEADQQGIFHQILTFIAVC
jgi:two-component system, OmpR family, phosphate regulon sensor histidine kinase PhoR